MDEETKNIEFPIHELNDSVLKTFFRMFLGLIVTAAASFYTYKSGLYITMLTGSTYSILLIVELAVVIIFSLLFKKLSPMIVTILFYVYAVINGVTMATIFAIFDMNTIFYAFLTTSLLFGGLALYGHITQKDMTKFGSIFMVGLFVGLIMSIFNIFIGNTMLDIILDWVILLIFCGLTVYDMNKIKTMQNYIQGDSQKIYIYCAMELYLDFINIFLRILSILGRNSRRN